MCGLCLNVLQQGGPQSAALGSVGAGGDYRTKLFLSQKWFTKDRQPRPRVTPAVLQLTQQVPIKVGVRQTQQTSNCCLFLSL